MTFVQGGRLGRCAGSVAIALAVLWGTVAPAEAGHGKTITTDVTVEVHRDGQSKARSALKLAQTSRGDVSAVNHAYAYAQCDDCRAVAAAFQIVLANRAPTNVAADNAAVAANENCERCETVAIAYQFVVVSPHRTQLTPAGHVRLAKIRFDLLLLTRSGRPAAEITAEAEGLAAEVASILTTELRTRPTIHHRVRMERTGPFRH